MKRSYIFLISLLSFAAVSCKTEQIENSTQESSVTQFKSEVDRVEHESGIKYFRKTLTLNDEKDENQVTILFASTDQTILNNYLQNYDLSIRPIDDDFAKEIGVSRTQENVSDAKPDRAQTGILIEALSVKLQKGFTGYTFISKAKNNVSKSDKGARPSLYSQHFEFISPVWPEYLILQIKVSTSVQLGWDRQDHWYSSNWNNADGGYRRFLGPTWFSQGVDGPYKVKAHVWCDLTFPDAWEITWRTDAP